MLRVPGGDDAAAGASFARSALAVNQTRQQATRPIVRRSAAGCAVAPAANPWAAAGFCLPANQNRT